MLPITGKHYTCIHIPSRETLYSYTLKGKMCFTYPITGKSFNLYPITENDHNYLYSITGRYSIHIPSRENKTHNQSANINCCIMNV